MAFKPKFMATKLFSLQILLSYCNS